MPILTTFIQYGAESSSQNNSAKKEIKVFQFLKKN